MRATLDFIRRFGFWRGIRFRRVAAKCDIDPRRCKPWAAKFRAKASDRFHHGDDDTGRVYLAFAEMLATTYDTLVLKKKPKRPVLTRQMRKVKRRVRKLRKKGRRHG